MIIKSEILEKDTVNYLNKNEGKKKQDISEVEISLDVLRLKRLN